MPDLTALRTMRPPRKEPRASLLRRKGTQPTHPDTPADSQSSQRLQLPLRLSAGCRGMRAPAGSAKLAPTKGVDQPTHGRENYMRALVLSH